MGIYVLVILKPKCGQLKCEYEENVNGKIWAAFTKVGEQLTI
jgi:hypothetical protein